MCTPQNAFFAKILLFGEYSLMHGSTALTIPFKQYGAALHMPHKTMDKKAERIAGYSSKQLNAFYDFLIGDRSWPLFRDIIDLELFKRDLDGGLYLSSNIPSGYGLGSSGALVAAVYDRYPVSNRRPMENTSLEELRTLFARMEAFFHGHSSGFDPLSIYANNPLHINKKQCPSLAGITPSSTKIMNRFFLINTNIPRKTNVLITLFGEKLQQKHFYDKFHREVIPCTDACVSATLAGSPDIRHHMSDLSQLQLELFREMIPGNYVSLWEEGLASQQYAVKLCGAGGGGFMLGYADNSNEVRKLLNKQHAQVIPLSI